MNRRSRRRRLRRRKFVRSDSLPARPATPTGPQLYEKDRTVTALQSLPDRMRDAFVLHRFEAWPYSRIAAHLDISLPEVMEAMTGALYALGTVQDMGEAQCTCAACVAATVREAMADAAALRAELEAAGQWP